MQKFVAFALSGFLAVSACTTLDPYTREERTSRTAAGAGIGALAGAAIGALTNTSSGEQAAKNALIGAGVGALAGAGVGAYMDRQARILRERLDETGVGVRRVGNTIELVMPGDVTFATDSANVASNFYPVLDDVALVLDEFDKTIVVVEGHTDSTGSDAYNQNLSINRANSVTSYLLSRGLQPQRFVVRGFGESRPIADNATDFGRQQNRRVAITLEPLT